VERSGSETQAIRLAMLTAGLAIAQQVAGKSLREGLFLSTYSVADLPKVMLGSALAAIPVVLMVARLMTRLGPNRLTPSLFVASAVLSLLEWALLPQVPRAIALVVYLHVSIGGALLVSAFWSVVNERFDPHELKHLIGRITASATIGGLVGGLAMERVVHWINARTALPLIACVSLLAAFSSFRLGKSESHTASATARANEPVRFTGYLWTLALLVTSMAAASAFADFALKQAAVARFGSAEGLVRFFALLYTAASLFSFVLQAFVARTLFANIGLGGTLAVNPLLGVGLGALSALVPSSATKRATKSLIDVVFDKAGDACASLIILLVSLGGPLLVQRAPALFATFAFAVGLLLALRARQGYVSELEASLRAGTVSVEAVEIEDPAARLTLSATSLGIDRDKLREQIERARAERAAKVEASAAAPPAEDPPGMQQTLQDVRTLMGTDIAAIRALLNRPELDPRLAAFTVPHLASEQLAKPSLAALRAMGPDVIGLLADVMLSSQQPLAVRRRVPHVLRALRGARVASALTRALSADALAVRYRAALALAEVTRDDRSLLPDPKDVFALALVEVERGPLSQEGSDHVFALLTLCTTRGSLELVRQGLKTDDRKLRGTALEYLESLLPEGVRAPLVRALSLRPEPRAPGNIRSETQLLDELKRSIATDLTPQTLAGDPD
jgi:hypothetical protein